jgi:hypothetical protein
LLFEKGKKMSLFQPWLGVKIGGANASNITGLFLSFAVPDHLHLAMAPDTNFDVAIDLAPALLYCIASQLN